MPRSTGFLPASRYRETIHKAILASPSRPLAQNHLSRLIAAAGKKALDHIPARHLPHLIRLLGSSSFLGEVLLGQGKQWPELFLRQIGIEEKTAAENLTELNAAAQSAGSFEDFCAALRRHKQREYLRIGARDLARQCQHQANGQLRYRQRS